MLGFLSICIRSLWGRVTIPVPFLLLFNVSIARWVRLKNHGGVRKQLESHFLLEDMMV